MNKGKIECIKEKNRLLIGILDKKLSGLENFVYFLMFPTGGHFVCFVMHGNQYCVTAMACA